VGEVLVMVWKLDFFLWQTMNDECCRSAS